MNNLIAVGDILKDPQTQTRYRIVDLAYENVVLCQMDTKKFILTMHSLKTIITLIADGGLIEESEDTIVFDAELLNGSVKEKYITRQAVVSEIMNIYGKRLTDLCGKSPKPELKVILEKYSMPTPSFWRMFTKYIQSGMKDSSLIDNRHFRSKGNAYNYTVKTGKPSEYFGRSGVLITDEIKEYFNEALKEYRSGRQKNLRACYDRMNALHFTKTELCNGVPTLVLLSEAERPTMRQFYYYANKQLTEQEKDVIKTSVQEQRNNKRLITSDSMFEVFGPGDMVEIDACEADVSLVSTFDPNKTIGRPIVYFMIDVFTRMILAVSVTFDNNSVLGITNLFLNLADDKLEYCKKYGMGFDNQAMWQSNIIPRRLRVDRGSEFKSKEFNRICNELGIEKQIVPGASGSLKGIVEQSFHQMHSKQNPHLENYGLIEKRYDSNHHKEATLNIKQYTKMVINFVLTHNQEYDASYPVTKEMIEQGIKPIPCFLWDYGIKKYGNPRPIPVREQYLFNLMTPVKAKIDRRGISYKKLYYLPDNDHELSKVMFKAGTKKIPFEARMDMRDVGHIYYLNNGKLIDAPLNERLSGNADFKGLTMKQYEDYLKKKKQMDAEGRIHNQELSVFNYAVNAAVVDEAKKETISDSKNMRPARELEKQSVSHEGNIMTRIETSSETSQKEPITIPDDVTVDNGKDYNNFEEALEDFWENN